MKTLINIFKILLLSVWGTAALLLPGSFMFHLIIYIIDKRGELFFSLANIIYGIVSVIISFSFFYTVTRTRLFKLKKG